MGFPVLTRLGINQFWYNYWYADKNYAANVQKTLNLKTLIELFLSYGLQYTSNPFIHEYWYSPKMSLSRTNVLDYQKKTYFRRLYYTHDILTIEHNYLLREQTPEYFPMRIWTLKYRSWLVFSVQWFKPAKQKIQTKYQRTPSLVSSFWVNKRGTKSTTRRIKLAYFLSIKHIKHFNKNYSF